MQSCVRKKKEKEQKADSTSYRVKKKKVLAGSTRKKNPPRGIDRSMDQSITITLQEVLYKCARDAGDWKCGIPIPRNSMIKQ